MHIITIDNGVYEQSYALEQEALEAAVEFGKLLMGNDTGIVMVEDTHSPYITVLHNIPVDGMYN